MKSGCKKHEAERHKSVKKVARAHSLQVMGRKNENFATKSSCGLSFLRCYCTKLAREDNKQDSFRLWVVMLKSM